jgi:hypothetical protein
MLRRLKNEADQKLIAERQAVLAKRDHENLQKQSEQEEWRMKDARDKNDTRRRKMMEREAENARKTREHEIVVEHRKKDLEKRDKIRMDLLEALNQGRKQVSLDKRLKKEEKILSAKE